MTDTEIKYKLIEIRLRYLMRKVEEIRQRHGSRRLDEEERHNIRGGNPENTGQFSKVEGNGSSAVTSDMEKQKKINNISIDFDNDNMLPGLNKETLDELGVEDKPVLLKKSVLDKNIERHSEIPAQFFGEIIGNALYKPDVVVKGHADKPYFNFIHSFDGNDNAVVLLQVKYTGSSFFEVVNFHLARDSSIKQKTRE